MDVAPLDIATVASAEVEEDPEVVARWCAVECQVSRVVTFDGWEGEVCAGGVHAVV